MVDRTHDSNKICWILTEGHAGMEGQCVGLAESLGLVPVIKRVQVPAPWKYLPARWWPSPLAMADVSTPLAAPWPDILISCGRRSAAAAAEIKYLNSRTVSIHIQVPPLPPESYDAVIVPEHDSLRGPNVIVMRGSLHRLSDQKLKEAAEIFSGQFEKFSSPRIGVLVGGSTKRQKFTEALAKDFAEKITEARKGLKEASLLLTPSRRTGEKNKDILRKVLGGPDAFIWNGKGENPYFGIMALSDFLIVTSDSVNMLSEACYTGNPVYIYDVPGGSRRLRKFQESLIRDGYARQFEGVLLPFTPPRLDEMKNISEILRDRYDLL